MNNMKSTSYQRIFINANSYSDHSEKDDNLTVTRFSFVKGSESMKVAKKILESVKDVERITMSAV